MSWEISQKDFIFVFRERENVAWEVKLLQRRELGRRISSKLAFHDFLMHFPAVHLQIQSNENAMRGTVIKKILLEIYFCRTCDSRTVVNRFRGQEAIFKIIATVKWITRASYKKIQKYEFILESEYLCTKIINMKKLNWISRSCKNRQNSLWMRK